MPSHDPRVDAFIAKSPDFAKPILEHVRAAVHAGCPQVEETIKWSFPFFCYKGKILCFMSAFTKHAAFGFYRGALVLGERGQNREAMGSFGRLTSVRDLPSRRVLAGFVRKAAAIAEAAGKMPVSARRGAKDLTKPAAPARPAKPALRVPPALAAALKKSAKLRARWEAFSPSHRREYLEWILGAKQEATRERRLTQAIAQIAEGKSQNWKYVRS